MESPSDNAHSRFIYSRDEVLTLKPAHKDATLPQFLFHNEYLTSHGKFSPDKYVECLWRNEHKQKPLNKIIRSDVPEILQNGSTLSPQRRGFSTGCKESLTTGPTGSSARNYKTDKRISSAHNPSWAKDANSSHKGFTSNNNNGYYRSSAGSTMYTRRDSDRVEPMPEWMDDGLESNSDVIPLEGFSDQDRRLEQSFQKLGLVDALPSRRNSMSSRRNSVSKPTTTATATTIKQELEKIITLPESDLEFAAQFGILDVGAVEAKMLKEQNEEPTVSRLSRFFGDKIIQNMERQEEGQKANPPPSASIQHVHEPPQQNETVLPAVARLLSGGTKTMGPPPTLQQRHQPLQKQPSEASSHNSIFDLIQHPASQQQQQRNPVPPAHRNTPPLTAFQAAPPSLPPHMHHSAFHHHHQQPSAPVMNRPAESAENPAPQKPIKHSGIDLVPTAVMLQRSTHKDNVGSGVRAPVFSNPNTPSPVHHHEQQQPETRPAQSSPLVDPAIVVQQPSMNGVPTQSAQWPHSGDSGAPDTLGPTPPSNTYIPALAQLGVHLFPVPNPLALAVDSKQISEAYQSGDYKMVANVQSRLNVQMQVIAAIQQFHSDASFTIVTANDSNFESKLEEFIEQQRRLDSSLSNKHDDELIECASPTSLGDYYARRVSADRTRHNRSVASSSEGHALNGSANNLNILKQLPASAKPMTVEELERQILGNS